MGNKKLLESTEMIWEPILGEGGGHAPSGKALDEMIVGSFMPLNQFISVFSYFNIHYVQYSFSVVSTRTIQTPPWSAPAFVVTGDFNGVVIDVKWNTLS